MSLIERKRKRKEMEYLVIPKDQETQEAMTPLGERLLKRGYNQTNSSPNGKIYNYKRLF